jgi:hypothetical protein
VKNTGASAASVSAEQRAELAGADRLAGLDQGREQEDDDGPGDSYLDDEEA